MIIPESWCPHLHPCVFLKYISKSFHQIFKMLHIPGCICTHLGIPENYLFHGHFLFPLVPADILWILAVLCRHYGKSKFITIFICDRLEMILPVAFRWIVFLAGCHADTVPDKMSMHMLSVCVDCIHSLIIITKHILRKVLQHIHCLLCRHFFFRWKWYDHMILLPFTRLMKNILCLFHLLKCCIRQAVNTAHQYTFFCLIWILNIFQSIL